MDGGLDLSSESDEYRFPNEAVVKNTNNDLLSGVRAPMLSAEHLAAVKLKAQEQAIEALWDKPILDDDDRRFLKDVLPAQLFESFILAKVTQPNYQFENSNLNLSMGAPDRQFPSKTEHSTEISHDYMVLRQQLLSVLQKDVQLTVMIVGQKQIGKSSLAQFLQTYKHTLVSLYEKNNTKFEGIVEMCAYMERKEMNVRLTIVDTPGFDPEDKTSLDNTFDKIEAYLQDKVALFSSRPPQPPPPPPRLPPQARQPQTATPPQIINTTPCPTRQSS